MLSLTQQGQNARVIVNDVIVNDNYFLKPNNKIIGKSKLHEVQQKGIFIILIKT